MAEITLVAQPGRATGSSESRRLRGAGRVPGVVYGKSVEPMHVSVDARELRRALTGESGANQLLSLEVAEARHLALARVIQRHPVRGTVVHVDFQVVSRDEIIAADVPVTLVGEAKAVELAQGLVEQPLTTLTVNARPGSIPTAIEVDIADLAVGDTIRVGQLALPSGVTTDVDPEEAVVVAAVSDVAAEVAEIEAEEAAAEASDAGSADAAEASGDGEAPAGGEG